MRRTPQSGFLLPASGVIKDILVPRYYDPRIEADLARLELDFDLPTLGSLVKAGHIVHTHGDYVPKIHYGTGPHPYIRTSDIANWEIKASPKHGVPSAVYAEYVRGQDIRERDILFVHEGTYLIGSAAMVTSQDGPILIQHHLAKFSVGETSPFDAHYLLASFEAPLVHRQVRARQFSADIIDSVVGRLEEIVIPIPKDKKRLSTISKAVKVAVEGRSHLRSRLSAACRNLDRWLAGITSEKIDRVLEAAPSADPAGAAFLGERRGFTVSSMRAGDLKSDVLLPKYYDPVVAEQMNSYERRCDLVDIGTLVDSGRLTLDTGDEIGRLNYGTGEIPFVRTSDFGSWELKRESKQGVSRDVWEMWQRRQDVRPGDILLVRDGTYLVGTSIVLHESDLPLLFCGGILRLRTLVPAQLPYGLLFGLLNLPFVKRQIRNLQFTRDVIDTLGHRVRELVLPIPKAIMARTAVDDFFREALRQRADYRSGLQSIMADMHRLRPTRTKATSAN